MGWRVWFTLLTHSLDALEVRSRISHELPVARMVDSLDADDFRPMFVIVLLDVVEKLELRRRRPDQQDLVAVFERAGDVAKESLGVVGVLLATIGPLWVPMMQMLRGRNDRFVDPVGVNFEDVSFLVIDPDGYAL